MEFEMRKCFPADWSSGHIRCGPRRDRLAPLFDNENERLK